MTLVNIDKKNIPNLFVSPSPGVKKGNHVLTLKQ
jgi:hypothetical protein